MNKMFRKIAILTILTFGLFFAAFDSSSQTSAAAIDCQVCNEMAAECRLYCEDNGPGCVWCTKKVERCYATCS